MWTIEILVCLGTDFFVEIRSGVQALKRILRKLLTLEPNLHSKSGNRETQGYQSKIINVDNGFPGCLGTDFFVEIRRGVQVLKRILRKPLTLKPNLHNKSGNRETQGYHSNFGTFQIGNSYWRYNNHKIPLSLRFF